MLCKKKYWQAFLFNSTPNFCQVFKESITKFEKLNLNSKNIKLSCLKKCLNSKCSKARNSNDILFLIEQLTFVSIL